MTTDMPDIGSTVVRLTRKNKVLYGEVIEHRNDGTYDFFIVEWSPDWRVEYPAKAYRDTVDPSTCPECDSENHRFHPGY
jgi:hypothetical protein